MIVLVYSDLDVVLGHSQYMLVELVIKGFLLAVLSRDFTSKGTWNTFNKCSNTLFSAFICICFYPLRSAGTALLSVAQPDWHLLLPPACTSMWGFQACIIASNPFLNHVFVSVCEGVGTQCAQSQFFLTQRFHKPNSGRQPW